MTVLLAHCLSAYQQLHSLQILKKKKKKPTKKQMCSNTLPPKATKHVPFVQVSTSLVTNSWCIHVYVQVSSLIPRLYCHFIKFKWSNFMFDTCLCVVPFLWQQQTTQLPKLNSHNEACLFICQSFQPELLEDGEQQVLLAFFNIVP